MIKDRVDRYGFDRAVSGYLQGRELPATVLDNFVARCWPPNEQRAVDWSSPTDTMCPTENLFPPNTNLCQHRPSGIRKTIVLAELQVQGFNYSQCPQPDFIPDGRQSKSACISPKCQYEEEPDRRRGIELRCFADER
ncbi:hypothetical protein FJV83_29625 [Mesorhizobium sp. WSM4307]|uniref:hypothetical protein n=1 Tax=unclassified Mesorhizobium TaxID=325217 RepID=UPI00115D6EB0|nr:MULTISPECIES: hypothetical protein [unclassified Mesorhizobium]TRC77980.1 hypothetical protein FJV81_10275 [Mesorhizobium sp. WSM4315]TRC78623.1 hypothetical protein FJV83_29625 [Mesorhizobium sp. WSM4307]TRC80250.1 hypothetical protein FJV80_23145 [Mesorhizobium sp. WSM4310]